MKRRAVNTRFIPHWDMDRTVIDYKIFQAPLDEETRSWVFEGWDRIKDNGFDPSKYEMVYQSYIDAGYFYDIGKADGYLPDYVDDIDVLNYLWELLNVNHPRNYFARSLSMSDVVQIGDKYYYVDTFGFKDITDEFRNTRWGSNGSKRKRAYEGQEDNTLARQMFVSLQRLYPYGYSVLSDGYFVKEIYAISDEDAIAKFKEEFPKAIVYEQNIRKARRSTRR